jgi:hypothetical protein
MIEMRRKQLSFGGGLIAEEASDLCENWMPHTDFFARQSAPAGFCVARRY